MTTKVPLWDLLRHSCVLFSYNTILLSDPLAETVLSPHVCADVSQIFLRLRSDHVFTFTSNSIKTSGSEQVLLGIQNLLEPVICFANLLTAALPQGALISSLFLKTGYSSS